MESNTFIPYAFESYTEAEIMQRSKDFYQELNRRRTVREFSDQSFDAKILENIILAAGTAPSGAHKQPWTYCLVSNPEMKKKIRAAAEEEEYENYHGRMSEDWLKDLEPFGTDHHKPFLEIAPYLIVVFKKVFDLDGEGKKTNYYVNESVGISVGMLISAIHMAGLVSLTHTPSPMNFLQELLGRPKNERAFLLIPVGLPVEGTQVPDLSRKELEEICVTYA